MSDIDPVKLRESIEDVRNHMKPWSASDGGRPHVERVLAAAEAYAATLPREVTFERWLVVSETGEDLGACHTKMSAVEFAERVHGGRQIVHLTGTATLPPKQA